MTTPTAGAALGNQLRAGTVAKVGSTKRIQELNGMLHANRPNVDITRARAYTKVYRATEGCPASCGGTRPPPRSTAPSPTTSMTTSSCGLAHQADPGGQLRH